MASYLDTMPDADVKPVYEAIGDEPGQEILIRVPAGQSDQVVGFFPHGCFEAFEEIMAPFGTREPAAKELQIGRVRLL